MTSTELLARVKFVLDETGTGTFWEDSKIYKQLDSGQNTCISRLLAKERELRLQGVPDFRHGSLKVLVKIADITPDPSVNTVSLSTLTDLLDIVSVALYETSSKATLGLEEITLEGLLRLTDNRYVASNYNSTSKKGKIYYTRYQGNLLTSLSAIPSTDYDKVRIGYYAQPSEIASPTNPTLLPETHEAIINYAVSYCLEKDGKTEQALAYFQKADSLISKL